MTITCNGKEKQVAATGTVLELIAELKLDPATVVVECDRKILKPEEYAGYCLHEGAVLELVRFVGGG
ncbi:MAG: thiamine biosynthesis protein ThiS [Deltaproteobacteria bacterium RIFOXYD12_FULL_50_9]|nr:MAG: thiamine biosynthesis protein ThiS [Deltaproteobacteria bacterium RIFOXYD12_FULL_50_9]